MERSFFLRFAESNDCDDIFLWRNDPVTIEYSPSGEVKYEDHVKWFKRKIQDANTVIFIVTNYQKEKIGMIRFDRNEKEAEVSININPLYRGKGYGKEVLLEALGLYFNNFDVDRIIARIVQGNIASKKIFATLKFREIENYGDDGTILTSVARDEFRINLS